MKFTILLAAGLALTASSAFADPVKIVAAENFYGDMAQQIGGDKVAVTSILTNPDQDPHLFEASVNTAKAVRDAQIVIVNGVDYDPWMETLLAASNVPARREILVGALVGRKSGDNPHLWYETAYITAAAKALVADLIAVDPAHANDYDKGYAHFLQSLTPLKDKFAAMHKTYAGFPVAASEPVFGYAAGAIGLNVRDQKFALSIMNNAEPSASDVAGFENDLKGRKVRAMLYNAQASEPAVQRLVQMAKDNHIPVVGVSETEPPNTNYQGWMMGQLDALDKALGSPIN